MNKPRILILENSIALTGALQSAIRSSLYLKYDYEFIFLLPSGSKAIETVRQHGFECLELKMLEISKNIFAVLFYIPCLLINVRNFFRLIKHNKINLIVNNDFYNILPVVYKFLGGKLPYVCYVRFLPSKFPSLLIELWHGAHAKYASTIVAVSEIVKRQLRATPKLVVIHNELPEYEMSFKPASSQIILYPSNYIPGKGHEKALESFSRINLNFPAWKLRFVGGDMGLKKNKNYKDYLQKKAKQLGIDKQVEWGEFRNSDEMVNEYLCAGLVINFSESESFSLTCLEAMFYGRPVIATRCGGPEEIIDQDISGVLVPVGNVDAIAAALKRILADVVDRNNLARNAYNIVREKFSARNTIEKLKEVYQSSLLGINTIS